MSPSTPSSISSSLFNDALIISSKRPVSQRKVMLIWTSVFLHVFGGAAVFAGSLMTFETLERPPIKGVFNAPPPPPPPPPPPKKRSNPTPTPVTPVTPVVRPTPTAIHVPTKIVEPPKDAAPADAGPDTGSDDGVEGGVEGGVVGGVIGGVVGGTLGGVVGAADAGLTLKEYEVSEPPKLITRVEPTYPEQARANGQEGKVFLELVVDENGRVVDARVIRADNQLFEQAARKAVMQWKYTAARNNGRNVRTYKNVTIIFTLH